MANEGDVADVKDQIGAVRVTLEDGDVIKPFGLEESSTRRVESADDGSSGDLLLVADVNQDFLFLVNQRDVTDIKATFHLVDTDGR